MRALAAVETNSVAQGYLLADEAVKTAEVDLLEATAVCAGKFLAVFTGTPAAVRASVEAARSVAEPGLYFNHLYLARVHEDVCRALCGRPLDLAAGALGIFESYSAIESLELGDALAKRCPVRLLEIRTGRGLGGKSTVTFCGSLAAVEEAAVLLRTEGERRGLLSDVVVVARPSAEARQATVPHGPGYAACGACRDLEGDAS